MLYRVRSQPAGYHPSRMSDPVIGSRTPVDTPSTRPLAVTGVSKRTRTRPDCTMASGNEEGNDTVTERPVAYAESGIRKAGGFAEAVQRDRSTGLVEEACC